MLHGTQHLNCKLKSKHKSKKITITVIILILAIVYIAGSEFVLRAALVPEFMETLDAFGKATDIGYSTLVQSEDIDTNNEKSLNETELWLQEVGVQNYYMMSDDGFKLITTMFEQPANANGENNAAWVIVLHGYTGWKEEMYPYAYEFYKQGYNVLVPDLRAQGQSEGHYIGLGWEDRNDLKIWMDAVERLHPGCRFIVFGLSMGASTALILSGEADVQDRIDCVIADAAFTDGLSMFKDKCHDWLHIPSFGVIDTAGLLLRLHKGGYDIRKASALDAVTRSSIPTLFITGTEDKIVDPSNTEILYSACSAQKEKLLIKGAGHGQCIDKEPELYWNTIFDFIR